MNECVRQRGFNPKSCKQAGQSLDHRRDERAAAAVTAGIEAFKYNEAASAIYEFVWTCSATGTWSW